MAAIPLLQENERLALLISRVDDLAVLPHVVFKVLELTGGDDAPASELERTITVDPAFSSRVLVLANSAAFGLPKRVSSIREAIMFLGFRTIRSIAMTVGVFDLFVGKTDKESLRRREWWRHSIDSAVCSRWLARKSGQAGPDDAYTAGLLHLIGKTLLDRFGGDDYGRVQSIVDMGVPDFLAERKVYGCDHSHVGASAAARWGLPAILQGALLYIEPADADDPSRTLRACTALATRLAYLAKQGKFEEGHDLAPRWTLLTLDLPGEQVGTLVEEAASVIADAQMRI